MVKLFERGLSSFSGIFERPEPINEFAFQRMETLNQLFEQCAKYNCPPSCKSCCYGSILMSYTEFSAITVYLQQHWSAAQLQELFSGRLGLLNENGMLLCPFLNKDAAQDHCRIYPIRPLICRVFGTTAAPCDEGITPSCLDHELFNHGHQLLYYSGSQFIALNISQNWSLFEAPFALWCLADNSEEDRRLLCELLLQNGDSYRAIIFDRAHNSFFTLKEGKKLKILDSSPNERYY